MIPILVAIIVLVITGLFAWTVSSLLDAISRSRRLSKGDWSEAGTVR